jgi:hypothetical protein
VKCGIREIGIHSFEMSDRITRRSVSTRQPNIILRGAAGIDRLELSTGHRPSWKRLAPSDPVGVTGIFDIVMTPDGRSYVYSFYCDLSDLYLVTGLR